MEDTEFSLRQICGVLGFGETYRWGWECAADGVYRKKFRTVEFVLELCCTLQLGLETFGGTRGVVREG